MAIYQAVLLLTREGGGKRSTLTTLTAVDDVAETGIRVGARRAPGTAVNMYG